MLIRTWRNRAGKIRAALAGSAVPPPGRVWVLRAEADQASLHVHAGDTVVSGAGRSHRLLPTGVASVSAAQLTLDHLACAIITRELARPIDLSVQPVCGGPVVTVRLIPTPRRIGIASAWRSRDEYSVQEL